MASTARIAFILALSLCHPAAAQQPEAQEPSAPAMSYELHASDIAAKAVQTEAEKLIREGNKRMREGDILGARELYLKAVPLDAPEAALAMGRSYDPIYFARIDKKNAEPDPAKASEWYRKARLHPGPVYIDPPPGELIKRNPYCRIVGC
jgi:hypothetical protein